MKTGSWCAVAMALALSAPAVAQESGGTATTTDSMRQPGGLYDATPHTRKSMVSVWGLVSWWGLGVGARYTLPVVADGILAEINDSIEVEFGADFTPLSFAIYPFLDVPVEARWTFHVMPNLSLYGKISAGVELFFTPGGIAPGFLYNAAPGIIYRLGESLVFRGELGFRGFKGGIGFEF